MELVFEGLQAAGLLAAAAEMHYMAWNHHETQVAMQVRLALELVFEGLQAVGLPGGGSGGVNCVGWDAPQHSLRIGDAVTVTLASPPQPAAVSAAAAAAAKQPAQATKAADSKAAPARKPLAGLLSASGAEHSELNEAGRVRNANIDASRRQLPL